MHHNLHEGKLGVLVLAPEEGLGVTDPELRERHLDQITLFRRDGTRALMLTEIDHIAIAVNDLEAAIEYYRDTYGVEVEHREVVERDGVEEALLKVADSYVQLLTPDPRRLHRRQVPRAARARASTTSATGSTTAPPRSSGSRPRAVALIDEEPRPGSRGTTVAFVHPKGAFGTLIELVEE